MQCDFGCYKNKCGCLTLGSQLRAPPQGPPQGPGYCSMGVFHAFKIIQMVPNRAKHILEFFAKIVKGYNFYLNTFILFFITICL